MVNLSIKDFQSLSKVGIKVEGFTVIIGESSSGKTAIFRALYAAVNNRFRPSHIQNGKEFAYVILDFGGEKKLKVRKGLSGSPDIILGNLQFNKLNRSVPQEVQDFVNFGDLVVGSESYALNFHPQFSKPLLLSFSQKKVMDLLSSSKGIDDYNKAHKALSEKRLTNKGAFDTISDILANDKSKLSKVESTLETYEPLYNKYTKLYELYLKNTKWLESTLLINQLLNSVSTEEKNLSLRNDLLSTQSKMDKINSLIGSVDLLNSIISSYEVLSKKHKLKSKYLSLLNNSIFKEASLIDLLGNLLVKEDAIESSLSSSNNKLNLFTSASKLDTNISKIKSDLLLVQSLEQLIDTHRKISYNLKNKKSNKCPMCGSTITNEEMKAKIQEEVNILTQELAVNKARIKELCETLNIQYDANLSTNLAKLKERLEFNLSKLEDECKNIQNEIAKLDEQH